MLDYKVPLIKMASLIVAAREDVLIIQNFWTVLALSLAWISQVKPNLFKAH